MRRPFSVGTRWALLYTLVTLLAFSLPIGFIYLNVKQQIERGAHLLLDSYMAEVRSEVEGNPGEPAEAVAAFTARLRRITPELDYGAALLRPDGSAVFRVGSLTRDSAAYRKIAAATDDPDDGFEVHTRSYLVASTPVAGGTIQAAISTRSFAGGVDQIRRLFAISAPLVLSLCAACGAWLARRSLRPIAHMTDSAQRIGGENLSERIPIRGNGDELDRLAATLNGMFDRISEAMRRLRGFSADAAHQLKSPIASLQNEIEVTLTEGGIDARTRRLLEGILDQVTELGTSVGAMLRLARSESGLSEGQAVPLELDRLLDGVATLFAPMAEERGIALELDSEPSVEILGDVAWLRELFANLVQNAIAHTPLGGRVAISLRSTDEEVEVRVSDTGEGIAKEEQNRIFDRFYRISPARGVPGSGLGLSLAQQIAVAHGGSIQLESEMGSGALFIVRLPRRGGRGLNGAAQRPRGRTSDGFLGLRA